MSCSQIDCASVWPCRSLDRDELTRRRCPCRPPKGAQPQQHGTAVVLAPGLLSGRRCREKSRTKRAALIEPMALLPQRNCSEQLMAMMSGRSPWSGQVLPTARRPAAGRLRPRHWAAARSTEPPMAGGASGSRAQVSREMFVRPVLRRTILVRGLNLRGGVAVCRTGIGMTPRVPRG